MTLLQVMPWVMSVTTLATNWLAGNKWLHTYKIGMANQAIWFAWVFMSHNYGFLPLNLFLTFIYYRNDRRWAHDARARGVTHG